MCETSLKSQLSISSGILKIITRGSSFKNYAHLKISILRLNTDLVGDGHIDKYCTE